jgi:polysaccharide export outer membrane protein
VGTRPAVPYFSNGLIDTVKVQAVTVPEQRIQKGDVLSISIFSDNPSATAIYNQAGGSGSAAPAGTSGERGMPASSPDGYLVDNNGYIRLHAIGLLKVEGITRQNLETLIIEKINQLGVLSNPYCVVRYSNFKITVLGEVRTPGVFTIPTEKVNVLEALGMAGDITDFGLKDQILLIRENGTSRTYANINLTDPAIFNSLNFYLQQNDVIVVKPDKKKPTSSDSLRLQYISLGLAAVSTIALIITLFR